MTAHDKRDGRTISRKGSKSLLSYIRKDKPQQKRDVGSDEKSRMRDESTNQNLSRLGEGVERKHGVEVEDAGENTNNVNVVKLDSLSDSEDRDIEFRIEEIPRVEEGYILDVGYDPQYNRAYIIIYIEGEGKLYRWMDRTGHKPYFLTDLEPEQVRSIIGRDPDFVDAYKVEKIDLLSYRKRYLTKIIVSNPLAVRKFRDKFPKAWEANIKYHHNYIYDNGIIPGLKYRIRNSKIQPLYSLSRDEVYETIDRDLSEESSEVKKLAIEWYPLFEEKPPRIKRASIDIEVYTPTRGRVPNPDVADLPIISIAVSDTEGRNYVFILDRGEIDVEKIKRELNNVEVRIYGSERDLIIDFYRHIRRYPLIVTYNGDSFDLPYLFVRSRKLGISDSDIPIVIKETHATFRHALHIDLYKFLKNRAIQNYAFNAKYKEHTLDAVATALLSKGKISSDEGVSAMDLEKLIEYNLRDSQLTLELTTFSGELIWKLIILLMRISKLGIEDVTRTQVSTWIKNLFYWEHRKHNYLIPLEKDLQAIKSKKTTDATIKGKKYAGAIVIDPPQGVFFNVTVLDFASLYPSIIKQWNLSYETVDFTDGSCRNQKSIVDEKGEEIHKVCMDKPGITSVIIGLLRDFRVKIYKKKSKRKDLDKDTRDWYDVVQRAMKVYINAAYGVFGHDKFPLYAVPVAESVTAIGRAIITSTLNKARELGLMVLYGDTDSLFIWDPDEETLSKLQSWVHATYGMELEADKKYRFVTFSLKKNYIGVLDDGTPDIKGLVGKKKNTPEFVKEAFTKVVSRLSSIQNEENILDIVEWLREELRAIYNRLKNREYTLDQLSFKVTLTKPLEAYTKNTPQHVKAARMLVREGITVTVGDNIAYIKVKGGDGVKPIQMAKVLEIDIEKYLESVRSVFEQILAPLNIEWEDIIGSSKLFDFIRR